MKRCFPVAIIGLAFALSCNTTTDKKQKKMNRFGLDYTKAWNSQKPEKVAAFFEEDGTLIVNKGEPITGSYGITEFVRGFMTAFPDMELTMDSLVKSNDRYSYHWTFKGTNIGPGGTGNKVVFSGFEQWTLGSDGRVKKSIGTFDEADYNLQIQGKEP